MYFYIGKILFNNDCFLSPPLFRTIQDPASQRLTWYKPPLTVLVIKKVRDATVIPPFINLVNWFIGEKNMVVFVEQAIMDEPLLTNNAGFTTIKVQKKVLSLS